MIFSGLLFVGVYFNQFYKKFYRNKNNTTMNYFREQKDKM